MTNGAEKLKAEARLIVKSSPLNVPLPADWATCEHEWEIYGDGGDLGGNRTEVICRKCKCPGDYEEDHWEVVWPTT
jgi:hypothetical protein